MRSCQLAEHVEEVHSAADYKQRRAIVDELGWEPFQEWFYEPDFRNWWQVGFLGLVECALYDDISTGSRFFAFFEYYGN